MAINRLEGRYEFLHNFYQFENGILTADGITVHTSEQLYLPSRFMDRAAREVVEKAPSGIDAKRLCSSLVRAGFERPDWDEIKIDKMRLAVMAKFQNNPELTTRLLATGDQQIVEGNTHGDKFWGVFPPPPTGIGDNWLGKILMETRDKLRQPDLDLSVDVDELVRRIFDQGDSTQPRLELPA